MLLSKQKNGYRIFHVNHCSLLIINGTFIMLLIVRQFLLQYKKMFSLTTMVLKTNSVVSVICFLSMNVVLCLEINNIIHHLFAVECRVKVV
jgi:hypothetical protein